MSKVVSLAEAVTKSVLPGAQIHFSFSHNRAHAAAYEVARQFHDRKCLDLVATGLLEYASVLVAAGAVRRLEGAFIGNNYPSPSPSGVLVQALADGQPHDPDWTNLNITLRLMAGAMGWPFVPTHSLGGSGLADGPGRAVMEDPFGKGRTTVMAPLAPDVAFVHGVLADPHGNTVIYGPNGEDLWGVWAAKKVVVTVEKVVSPEEMRRSCPRPGLPGHKVDFVVEAPFGAHPQALCVWNDDRVRPYAEDYEMRALLRRLTRDPAGLRAWVEEWVFSGTHEDYLLRLGKGRLESLQVRAETGIPAGIAEPVREVPASPEERAAVVAMRRAVACGEAGTHDVLFAGIGLSHIAAWAAEEACRHKGINMSLVAETGLYGYHPAKGDPYLFNPWNAQSSLFHSDFIRILGALAGPRSERCLTLLGAGQVDRRGNVNSSRNQKGDFLVGSGGANDLVKGNSDYLVVMPAGSGRLVPEVSFVTSPAGRLRAVCTDLGVLVPSPESGDLEIAAVMDHPEGGVDAVEALVRACGWPLVVGANIERLAPPTPGELSLLRSFDPKQVLLR